MYARGGLEVFSGCRGEDQPPHRRDQGRALEVEGERMPLLSSVGEERRRRQPNPDETEVGVLAGE
jgi:hypothetical protein